MIEAEGHNGDETAVIERLFQEVGSERAARSVLAYRAPNGGDSDEGEKLIIPGIQTLFVYRTAGAGLFKLLLKGRRFTGADGVSQRYSTQIGDQNVTWACDGQPRVAEITYAQYVQRIGEWRDSTEKTPVDRPYFASELHIMARAMSLADHEANAARLHAAALGTAKRNRPADRQLLPLQAAQHFMQLVRVNDAETALTVAYDQLVAVVAEERALGAHPNRGEI